MTSLGRLGPLGEVVAYLLHNGEAMRSLLLPLLLACSLARADDSIARGKAIFEDHCTMCHGVLGNGKGELASELPLRPRNFLGEALQWGNSIESVIATISHGRSEVMPEFDSVLTPAEIADVANWVWSLIPGDLKKREFKPGTHLAPTTRVFVVRQRGKVFVPASVSAHVGDMIVFVNDDTVVHEVHDTVNHKARTIRSQKPLQWDRVVLTEPGTLRFGCAFHAAMRLDVKVDP